MIKKTSPEGNSPHLVQRIISAFETPPDSAGILQGVRKIRKGRHHARTVLFPSEKNGGYLMPCEGRLEGDTALCLELNPTIDEYRSQPFTLPGPNNRQITPDFALRRGAFFAVIDVKPHGQLAHPDVTQRMGSIRQQLAAVGIPHYVITEQDLHKNIALQIRTKLRLGLKSRVSATQRIHLLKCLGNSIISLQQLREEATRLGMPVFGIEKLAIQGDLQFPLSTFWKQSNLLGATNETDRTTHAGWGTVHDISLSL